MKNKIEKELKRFFFFGGGGGLGYFEGRQSTKRWIVDEDLVQMYLKHKRGEIHLWYNKNEIEVEELEPPSKRTKEGNGCTRHQEKGKRIEEAFEELCKKHQDSYTRPQLKLWARIIINDIHESYDHPPKVPMITGSIPKPKKESLSEAIADAFMKPVSPINAPAHQVPKQIEVTKSCTSSGRCADIRFKNLQQLRYL